MHERDATPTAHASDVYKIVLETRVKKVLSSPRKEDFGAERLITWRNATRFHVTATFLDCSYDPSTLHSSSINCQQSLQHVATSMRLLWLLIPLAPTVFAQPSNDSESLFWGTYRPNLYFGLRPRTPQSLMTGLMWFGTQDFQSITRTRHACDQGDHLDSYTWTEYDAREGGVQVIKDSLNNVKLTTEFLKIPGGQNGGSWAARIKGEPLNLGSPSRISTIFYFGLEGLGGIDMETEENENGIDGPVQFSGSSPDLEDFTIRIVDDPKNTMVTDGPYAAAFTNRIGKTHFAGFRVEPGNVWQAKDLIVQNIVKYAQEVVAPYQDPTKGYPDPSFVFQLPDEVYFGSNLYAIQKSFDGPFQFDVFFESSSSKQKLSSAILDEGIPALSASYNKRFEKIFPVPASYPIPDHDSLKAFSKAITSNLVGGIGYFYGTSIVDRSFAYEWDQDEDSDVDEGEKKGARLTEPKALLTATPSRSFFPRGFYWDEGFHLLHIGEWDNDLSLEILKDWISLIDEDGWVAREQILGEEARSKVPAEFQTQVPTFANPPTLTMAVTAFISRLKSIREPSNQDLGMDLGIGSQAPLTGGTPHSAGSRYLESPELALEFLQSIYKPLKRHYDWFRRTQRGQIKQYGRRARSRTEAYRWRGRSQQHVLTSGMDDYPRGPPHAGELHLDLISWMGFFSRTMREIAEFVGETDDAAAFEEIENATLGNIDDLHWSEEEQMYCDVSVNDEDESYHVCHKGYLSLFPFLLSLLPADSPHLGAILDLLRDPEHLWSPYGLRSLSASHPEFGQGENYWKGPIWVQMNYLALSALYKTYAAQEGPYQQRAQEIYTELRKNIVDNVSTNVRAMFGNTIPDAISTSHPFTGWTSLVTLILSEKY
ncbi:putative mannosyl-oligosaccharide glucosidase [Grifola frondosa]|uniref:Mannosyl-oligosaccharide glucosidase n=1 Tax=Grifola frondosa TaxID=5627 RepID=A0A1C7MH12_GRIFR|nr:putative mannosyl-oligosaccharide glucosidase [Grifola frondosa]